MTKSTSDMTTLWDQAPSLNMRISDGPLQRRRDDHLDRAPHAHRAPRALRWSRRRRDAAHAGVLCGRRRRRRRTERRECRPQRPRGESDPWRPHPVAQPGRRGSLGAPARFERGQAARWLYCSLVSTKSGRPRRGRPLLEILNPCMASTRVVHTRRSARESVPFLAGFSPLSLFPPDTPQCYIPRVRFPSRVRLFSGFLCLHRLHRRERSLPFSLPTFNYVLS